MTACADRPASVAPAAAPAVPESATTPAVEPARHPDLREDVGGWSPPADLVERALRMRAPAARETALADLDADTRIDALRAGLRLRDDTAAIACAARLTYHDMSNWECARAVELLLPTFLDEDSESQFHEFRAYLGSVELPELLTTLPPRPWRYDTGIFFGAMHRVMRGEHLPIYCELARSDDAEVARVALSQTELLQIWNDTHRRESAAVYLGLPATVAADSPGDGMDPLLVGLLQMWFVDAAAPELESRVSNWVLRWLADARPAADDERFLIELARAGGGDDTRHGAVATILLGLLEGAPSDDYLRARTIDADDKMAMLALARRGDKRALSIVEERAAVDEASLALLLERDPTRARRVVETVLLGSDSHRAANLLDVVESVTAPAAYDDHYGLRWQTSAFDGFAASALAAEIDAIRLAWIGAVVPGCRTLAIAREAANRLDETFFAEPEFEGDAVRYRPNVLAFLEAGAPVQLRRALRRVAADSPSAHDAALSMLLTIGDPDASPELLDVAEAEIAAETLYDGLLVVARSRGRAVQAFLEEQVRLAGTQPESLSEAIAALATFHGLPRRVSDGGAWESPIGASVVEVVLDGRPVDGLAIQLAAHPAEFAFNDGLVNDPRIAAYLQSFRKRRSLKCYWYATGELAAMGDPEARADFWGAMVDGRYRIMDNADKCVRTLGFDLPGTVPFWIGELRSQCCRIVTGGEGDIMDDLFGLDIYATEFRTSYERVQAHWQAANGEFVWSHFASHYVPAVR